MRHLRLALELLGLALYLAVHYGIAWVYILGSPAGGVIAILYWVAISLGYLAMLGIAVVRPTRLRAVAARRAFDAWLLAAVPALAVSVVLVLMRWPLELPSWDGHGMGSTGGEVNAVFFPWLHGLVWIGILPRVAAARIQKSPG